MLAQFWVWGTWNCEKVLFVCIYNDVGQLFVRHIWERDQYAELVDGLPLVKSEDRSMYESLHSPP